MRPAPFLDVVSTIVDLYQRPGPDQRVHVIVSPANKPIEMLVEVKTVKQTERNLAPLANGATQKRRLREIDARPDVNVRDEVHGQTALMWAAARGNAPAIHVLAEVGADIHARTERVGGGGFGGYRSPFASSPPTGFTPLLFAVRGGHLDAVIVLLEAGADVNGTLSDGQSALVVATANANWQLANYLMDQGADPNAAEAGWNALHQTVRTRRMNVGFGTPGPITAGTVDSIDVLDKLIAKGVDVNARMTKNGIRDGQRNRLNRLGATAFFLAAKITDVEAMKVLVAAGADANIPSAEHTTPLMVAAGLDIWNPGEDGGSLPGQEEEVLEAVRMCVELGNDVNAVNNLQETALHGAAFRGANIVVEYLVEQGAKLDARDQNGWIPWAVPPRPKRWPAPRPARSRDRLRADPWC